MAWYRTGTVTVTNGSASVTGSGTLWVANAVAGYGILLPDGRLYEIASISSDTGLTLATTYLGSTASGQAYAIAPLRGPEVKLAQDIAALINDYGAAFLTAGQGKFATGTVSAPSVRNSADENTGVNLLGADQLQLVTGGVQRMLLNTTAMSVSVPITGTAVTQSATDSTAGRLLKVGDTRISSGNGASISDDLNNAEGLGFWSIATSTNAPTGYSGLGSLLTMQRASTRRSQIAMAGGTANLISVRNQDDTGAWRAWARLYHEQNIVGTVSQSGGTPTNAIIEQGSSANGRYARWADGTQICYISVDDTAGAWNNAIGAFFYRSSYNWTFPAVFSAAPVVIGTAQIGDDRILGVRPRAVPTTTTAAMAVWADTSAAAGLAKNIYLTAIGRWF